MQPMRTGESGNTFSNCAYDGKLTASPTEKAAIRFRRRSGTRAGVVRRACFVARIQRIIGAFDEDLAPLDQSRSEKTEHGADDDLLHKCRVHDQNCSTTGATAEAFRLRGSSKSQCAEV